LAKIVFHFIKKGLPNLGKEELDAVIGGFYGMKTESLIAHHDRTAISKSIPWI